MPSALHEPLHELLRDTSMEANVTSFQVRTNTEWGYLVGWHMSVYVYTQTNKRVVLAAIQTNSEFVCLVCIWVCRVGLHMSMYVYTPVSV